jgi:hypothetical protein
MAMAADMGGPSHFYASFAICPLSLSVWFIQMEPFTTLHIELQAGKFDHASRQFGSIADSYYSVTRQPNDYRELPPEFFFQPEFLVNENGFDLGCINQVRLNDVILPPWAPRPMKFIYLMRKALKSRQASELASLD